MKLFAWTLLALMGLATIAEEADARCRRRGGRRHATACGATYGGCGASYAGACGGP